MGRVYILNDRSAIIKKQGVILGTVGPTERSVHWELNTYCQKLNDAQMSLGHPVLLLSTHYSASQQITTLNLINYAIQLIELYSVYRIQMLEARAIFNKRF